MSAPRLLLVLAVLLAVAVAFAAPPRNPQPPSTPVVPEPSGPTPAEYRLNIEGGSFTEAYYEIYRCSRPALGQYTTVIARASTNSHPHKSRYLAHNVRHFIDGRLTARHSDIVQQVHGAPEHNFITSIAVAEVRVEISCPRAFVARIEAEGWHKGISIHGYAHTFFTRRSFHG